MRLHVVSGKGGTGKTTVAAALALALATDGRRVLLLEVEGRQGIAQLFDTAPLPYEERPVAVAPGNGDVIALAIDPEAALLEYLEMFYNLKRAGTALRKLGAIDFATTIAPGIRDVLLTGKAIEAVKRTHRDGRPVYDAVVMDAPPTGRIARFLNVNTEVAGLAKVGPIRNHANSVMEVLRSRRTAVHLVTLLEEMPMQETLDGFADLTAAGLPVGAVIVNMLRDLRLPDDELIMASSGRLDARQVAQGLKAAGLPHRVDVNALAQTLVDEAADHAARIELERAERARLDGMSCPIYELAFLPGGIDPAALYELAAALRAQGAA